MITREIWRKCVFKFKVVVVSVDDLALLCSSLLDHLQAQWWPISQPVNTVYIYTGQAPNGLKRNNTFFVGV